MQLVFLSPFDGWSGSIFYDVCYKYKSSTPPIQIFYRMPRKLAVSLFFYDFRPKIDFFAKQINLFQQLKFWPKIDFFAEKINLFQQLKFWPKIEILIKNLGQKSKSWSKIEILVKNRNFGQKSKFWSKIEILAKNRTFGQKS